jgi:hypothetical protein
LVYASPLTTARRSGLCDPNSILTAVETDSDGFFTGMEGGAIAKHRFTKDLESLMKKYWDAGVPFLVSMYLEILGG